MRMKRRRNYLAELAEAMLPVAVRTGADVLVSRRRRRRRMPKIPTEVPGFTTIDEWNPEIGGSKVGQIRVDYDKLVEVFGEPIETPEGVDGEWWPSVNWYLEFEDDSTCMIYDWQAADPVEDNRIWHVAGRGPVLGYIAALLSLPPEQVEDEQLLFSDIR